MKTESTIDCFPVYRMNLPEKLESSGGPINLQILSIDSTNILVRINIKNIPTTAGYIDVKVEDILKAILNCSNNIG